MQIDFFTKPLQKKKTQDIINKLEKYLVKFVDENHTDEIMYARLVTDEPSEIQHYRKSLSNSITHPKN